MKIAEDKNTKHLVERWNIKCVVNEADEGCSVHTFLPISSNLPSASLSSANVKSLSPPQLEAQFR